MIKLSPINAKRWQRFKANKLALSCLVLFTTFTLVSFAAEVFFNDHALIVSYEGKTRFPIFAKHIPATEFGRVGDAAPNYLEMKADFAKEGKGNWVLMPLVPYGKRSVEKIDQTDIDKAMLVLNKDFTQRFAKLEQKTFTTVEAKKKAIVKLRLEETRVKGALEKKKYHPLPPSGRHFFGTEVNGRDIFAQIVYGYRVAIIFALALLLINYTLGVTIGCIMGFFGGWVDLLVQRIIEILTNIPFLYIVIIVAATLRDKNIEMGFGYLLAIFAFFGWMGMTWYMRTTTLKEKSRDYITAAKALGAGNGRIIFTHLLPNVVSLLVTFIPFSVSGAIVGLTSLDYLGYGLPKDWPSWGRLIQIGTKDMTSYWIVLSVVMAMIMVLFLINCIGEGLREAFDPKKISSYE